MNYTHKKFLSSTEHLYVQIFNDLICINLFFSRQGSPSKITCSSFGQWWPTSAASSHWGRNRWEQTKTGHWPRANGTLKNVQSIWENPGGWPSLCKSSIHCNIVPKYFFHLWLSITRYISAGSRISERGSANVFKSSCGASEKKTTNYILFLDGMLYKMCSNLEILCLQNVLCPYVRCPVEPPNRTCQQTEVLAGYIRGRQCLRCAACIDDAPDLLESDQYQPPHWFQWRILQIE